MNIPLENIVTPLLSWFEINKRELPWRKDHHPYHVWISEIMLQQTRIEAVRKYYVNFMKELPDIESLSLVSEEHLLKLWEGLGYYSRARNLKKAAEIIMQEYNGVFPTSYAELVKLPGIGEYTAGAIASICYQEKVTAIDGNVLRVISRVTGSRKNVLLPETKKEVEKQLCQILPKQSGDFNEALMELGEILCLPNGTPECEPCPLKSDCIAYKNHLTAEIPVRIKKIKRKKEEKTVLLLVSEAGQIAIEKRAEKGLLSGMYQFPNLESFYSEEELAALLKEWQLVPVEISFLKNAKHVFTHIDWHMKGYLVKVKKISEKELINESGLCKTSKEAELSHAENTTNNETKLHENLVSPPHLLWVSKNELSEKYPLPTAFQIFLLLVY